MAMLRHVLGGITMLFAPIGDGAPGAGDPPIPEDLGKAGKQTAPFATFLDAETFNKRMDREARARMREQFGTDDPEVVKAKLARAAELESQEAERKKAAMSEADRLKAEKAEADQRATRAEAERDQERLQRHIAGECAAKGIKSVDYASFLIEKATDALPAGQQLDVAKFLDEQLTDETKKVALGITVPAPTVVPDPATTVPSAGTPPPPPPKAGETGVTKTAMEMTAEEFGKHKQSLGLA
jgi:hypothetical protein